MKSIGDITPLVLPSALLAEVEAAADEEHRSALDVLQDAVKGYVKARRRDRRVFRTEELTAAEIKAIAERRMDPRHDHLNAELE